MKGKGKYAIIVTVIIFLSLLHVNLSINPMPMCQTCAADDGYSCIVCSSCQTYAVLVSGIPFII